jgi:hypothetical protein
MPMKNTLSYLAGYIDGDGCFFLKKETNPLKYRAYIVISSTNEEVLKTFELSFGGSIYACTPRKEHWKRSYHWNCRGKFALEITNAMLEFLTEKKSDALIFIDYIKTSCKNHKQELIQKMKNNRDKIREINESVVEQIKQTKTIGVSNELDYPYLAGFIDAECCLGVSKYKPKNKPNFTYKIILQCQNTNPIIFFWLMERFGGSISHVKRNIKNPNHRDQIIWNISAAKLADILPKILPFLRSKKSVCEKLIELHNTNIPIGISRKTQEFRDSYALVLIQRDKIVDDIHKLNSKGV